jgi:hypothetical protein
LESNRAIPSTHRAVVRGSCRQVHPSPASLKRQRASSFRRIVTVLSDAVMLPPKAKVGVPNASRKPTSAGSPHPRLIRYAGSRPALHGSPSFTAVNSNNETILRAPSAGVRSPS